MHLPSSGQPGSWRYFLERCVHLHNKVKHWNRNSISWDNCFLWKTNSLACAVRFIHLQFPGTAKTRQAVILFLKIICWLQHFILVGIVIAEGWVLHSFLQQYSQQSFLLSKVSSVLYNSTYSHGSSWPPSSVSTQKNFRCSGKGGSTVKERGMAVMVQHTLLMGKSLLIFCEPGVVT